jgi:hypothetical protein
MMDNLARIISHGFAIVVVILLGIGFIYRGELFPDLELPDFLVPESGKMADAGDHQDKLQPGIAATPGTVVSKPVEATPSVPAAPAVEAPVVSPEAGVEALEPPPSGVEGEAITAKPAVQESTETEIVTETTVETLQAPVEEPPPPAAEVPESTEGANAGSGETGNDITTGTLPSTVPYEGPSAESRLEAPDSSANAQPAAVAEEAPSEAAISQDAVPQTAPPTPIAGEESQPVTADDEGPAVAATGTAVQGSTPVTAGEVQPDVGVAGQSPGGSAVEVKPYELLAAAREAFWLHNYDDAEKNYRALTELEPQNPDGYGELGNMYFSQGRWEEAAAAYYAAGIRLITEGRLDSARELVIVIRGLNGQQADELDKLITSAASTGNH